MPRKRSRACSSSRACPRSVSMKPRQGRQGRAQLVAGVGQKIRPSALAAPEFGFVPQDQYRQPAVPAIAGEGRGARAPHPILRATRLVHDIAGLRVEQGVVDDAQDFGRADRGRQGGPPACGCAADRARRCWRRDNVGALRSPLSPPSTRSTGIGELIEHLSKRGRALYGGPGRDRRRRLRGRRLERRGPRCTGPRAGSRRAALRPSCGQPVSARQPRQQQWRGDARCRRRNCGQRPGSARGRSRRWICHEFGQARLGGMLTSHPRGVSCV